MARDLPEKTVKTTNLRNLALALIVLAVIVMLFLGIRQSPLVEVDSGTFMTMGTFGRIQLRCRSEPVGRDALTAAHEELDRIDRLLSTYRQDSQLARVNKTASQEPVSICPETYQVLKKAKEYNLKTNGAFDITVGHLLAIWKKAQKSNQLPTPQQLQQARRLVGSEKLTLSESSPCTVYFTQPGMKLNVNALAKGYAVDCVLSVLRRPGIAAALVDIGGEIAGFGRNRPDKDWLVGIQDPFAPDNEDPLNTKPEWVVRLHDCAVATSGNYRQYQTIQGEKYSHIIDPRSGQPAQKVPSVTVIAPLTIDADALATALSVLGPEKGLALIESLPNTEALIITGTREHPQLHRSRGFSQYEKTD